MRATSTPDPQTTYQDWNLSYGEAHSEEYGEDEARRRYEAREGFWVLLGDPASPDIVLEVQINRYAVKVAFLDERRRATTTYLFVPGKFDDPDLMLLEQHRQLGYDNDTPAGYDDMATGQGTFYNPDGSWYHVGGPLEEPAIETCGQLTTEQLKSLIEPFPAFGDWTVITRPRTLPPGRMTSMSSEQAQAQVAGVLGPGAVLGTSATQPEMAASGAPVGFAAPSATAAALDRLAGQVNQLAAASGAAARGAGMSRSGPHALAASLPDGSSLSLRPVEQQLAGGMAVHASSHGIALEVWGTMFPHVAAVLDELACLYGAASPQRPAGRGTADSDAVWLAKIAGLDTRNYYLSEGQPHRYPNPLPLPNGQPLPALAWSDTAGYQFADNDPEHSRLDGDSLPMARAGSESHPLTYQGWNPAFSEPHGEEYGEVEARRRYEAREGFLVLLGRPGSPQIVVEFEDGRNGVKVAFLDDLLREEISYFFEPGKFDDPGLMLLSKHRRFSYDTNDPGSRWSAEAVWAEPDGHWYRNQQTRWQPLVETRGQFAAEQLPLLVEPFPAFGDWAGVTRPRQFPAGNE